MGSRVARSGSRVCSATQGKALVRVWSCMCAVHARTWQLVAAAPHLERHSHGVVAVQHEREVVPDVSGRQALGAQHGAGLAVWGAALAADALVGH